MRYFGTLIVIASIEYWLVMPLWINPNAPFTWNALLALVGGIVFALGAIAFSGKKTSILSLPTFVMIGVLATLGFGNAYGEARDQGLELRNAELQALVGWPGAFFVVTLVGILYILKSRRLGRRSEPVKEKPRVKPSKQLRSEPLTRTQIIDRLNRIVCDPNTPAAEKEWANDRLQKFNRLDPTRN